VTISTRGGPPREKISGAMLSGAAAEAPASSWSGPASTGSAAEGSVRREHPAAKTSAAKRAQRRRGSIRGIGERALRCPVHPDGARRAPRCGLQPVLGYEPIDPVPLAIPSQHLDVTVVEAPGLAWPAQANRALEAHRRELLRDPGIEIVLRFR